jgi:large subunit ribosomal protein L6
MPEGVTAEAVPSTPTTENGFLASTITLKSHDKQMLGDIAADIRASRPVEPYKGKGLRYKDEMVKRKLGKQAKSEKK